MSKHRLGQGVSRFSFVEPGLTFPTQFRIFQPIQHEECPLDASDFTESQIESILLPVATELSQRGRRLDRFGFGAACQPYGVTPMQAGRRGLRDFGLISSR